MTRAGAQLLPGAATLLLWLCWLPLPPLASAQIAGGPVQQLVVQPGKAPGDITAFTTYWIDETGEAALEDVLTGDEGIEFAPIRSGEIDFGYSYSRYWVRTQISNPHDEPWIGILHSRQRFMTELETWLVIDGERSLILEDNWRKPFGEREIPYRYLAAKLEIPAGSRGELITQWRSHGTSNLPMSLETELTFRDSVWRGRVHGAVVVAIAVCVLVFALGSIAAMQKKVHLSYAAYFAVAVTYVLHMEGFTFPVLWPGLPEWNSYASLVLGYGLTPTACVFSQYFLSTGKHHPRLDRLLKTLFWISSAIICFSWLLPTLYIKQFGFVFTCIVLIVFLTAGWLALKRAHPGAGYYLFAWSILFVTGIASIAIHWIAATAEADVSVDFISYGIFVEAMMFLFAINAQIAALRRDHIAATRAELRALQKSVEADKERAYAEALAQTWRSKLATASHDIKQPLFALRLALERHGNELGRQTTADIRSSFHYLEDLIATELDRSAYQQTGDESGGIVPVIQHGSAGHSAQIDLALPVSVLMESVLKMFQSRAQARGIDLTAVSSSLTVCVNGVAAMRILANLVSNAVEHSRGPRILLGARRKGSRVFVEVWDQGPGLSPETLSRLAGAYEKGPQSSGHGLGLSIATSLAKENGYEFKVRSWPPKGSCFALALPLAPADQAIAGDSPPAQEPHAKV